MMNDLNKNSKTCSKSKSATRLLSISASSTVSEQVFNETGRILQARLQQLNLDSVALLVFLGHFR
jgi:hypothetical protein